MMPGSPSAQNFMLSPMASSLGLSDSVHNMTEAEIQKRKKRQMLDPTSVNPNSPMSALFSSTGNQY
jgi:hypothetical protein